MMNSVRSTRPISRNATANSCCRGYAANFRKSRLGGIAPATIVAALRRISGQLELMTGSLTLPPIKPFSSFGQDAGSKR